MTRPLAAFILAALAGACCAAQDRRRGDGSMLSALRALAAYGPVLRASEAYGWPGQ